MQDRPRGPRDADHHFRLRRCLDNGPVAELTRVSFRRTYCRYQCPIVLLSGLIHHQFSQLTKLKIRYHAHLSGCGGGWLMKVVKAAAVQISPVLYSRDGTVEKITRKIHELGEQGVQFATFPETVVPYYPYFAFIQTPFQII